MERVILIGAGGHAQVVADILMRAREAGSAACPIGYLDDNPALHGQLFLGLPVLGDIACVSQIAHDSVVIAIGDNYRRRQLFQALAKAGERFIVAAHPRAVLAPDIQIGPGAVVCAGVVVNTGSTIGANVILNTSCSIDHHNHLADHVHVAPGAHLGGEVSVGEGALIGIGATIAPRQQVGAWSIVGAGACVVSPVPDGVTVVGVPALPLLRSRRRSRIMTPGGDG